MKSLLILAAFCVLSLTIQAAGVLWPYKEAAAQQRSAVLKVSCDANYNLKIETVPQ